MKLIFVNIFSNLLKKKVVKYYHKTSNYPVINELKKIVLSIKKFNPDLIIAVGGGSVMDYAKISNAINFTKKLEKSIINHQYELIKKKTKLICIPTTSGSGAEVTSNAVIYINGIKHSIEGDLIKPDYFFLIPKLVIKSPKAIKASAGVDAIAQAVESLISKKSNSQSVIFAQKSLEISLKYFLESLKNPTKYNTSYMCISANLAGRAINISKTVAPHAVSYPFTSLYNVGHGHAVS